MLKTFVALAYLALFAEAFLPLAPLTHTFGTATSLAGSKLSYDQISDVGYAVSVSKPLGVVFGENGEPYKGLVLDDVEPGQNGGSAGLRVGDQLMAINGRVVLGEDFDSVMSTLVAATGDLELQLFRGSVRTMFETLDNVMGDLAGDEDDEDSEEEVIMDENYESPVVVNLEDYEDKPLSFGDVFKAVKKVGEMLTEKDESPASAPAPAEKTEKTEKSGGIFGLFQQETIQLDGDDASGLKGQTRRQ